MARDIYNATHSPLLGLAATDIRRTAKAKLALKEVA